MTFMDCTGSGDALVIKGLHLKKKKSFSLLLYLVFLLMLSVCSEILLH